MVIYQHEPGDPRPCIYDCAGSNFTNCGSHPSGSHKNGATFDTGYFTYGKTNNTQPYRSDSRNKEYPITSMNHFNAPRTARFLTMLHRAFPDFGWCTHVTLWSRLTQYLTPEVIKCGSSDDNTSWNHDQHLHIYSLGRNYAGRIVWI